MGLNAKQKRFAQEYSVDHNGAQAAIRAGYSENRAKQTGCRLVANVAVRQLLAKLDERKRAELGIEGTAALEHVDELLAEARVVQPKIWKGEPVIGSTQSAQKRPWRRVRTPVTRSEMEHRVCDPGVRVRITVQPLRLGRNRQI